MKATVTREFRGQGDHDTSERFFAVGETIFGELAKAAVKAGNAKTERAAPKGKAKGK